MRGKSLDESGDEPESTDFVEEESTTSGDVEAVSDDENTEGEKSEEGSVELRIVGGRLATPQSWPFAVALHRDGKFICGATIIDPMWIVTAGHCLYEFDTKKFGFQV